MAPGPCTCGGWYAHRKCTNPQCAAPEGPSARSFRLEQAAAEARDVCAQAVRGGVLNAPQFQAWSAALDELARLARNEAREARRAVE
eukprot:9389447-Alexandrium_andersonii.AAC.1